MRNKENNWKGVNNAVRIRRGKGSGGGGGYYGHRAAFLIRRERELVPPGKNQDCLFIIGSHNTISQLCPLLPLPEGCGDHSTWRSLPIALVLTYHTLRLSSLWGSYLCPFPKGCFFSGCTVCRRAILRCKL